MTGEGLPKETTEPTTKEFGVYKHTYPRLTEMDVVRGALFANNEAVLDQEETMAQTERAPENQTEQEAA